MTCKDFLIWISHLWAIPGAIILGIAYLFAKEQILDYYDNVLVYYLNYFNILDLIFMYFEFGFSIMDTVRYYCRTCCKKEEYKNYIKGKLIYYKREYKKKIKKELDELSSINDAYKEEIHNFNLTKIYVLKDKYSKLIENQNNYAQPDYNKSQKNKIENIKESQLEKLIATHCREVKSLGRKIIRINNLENRMIKGIDSEKKCCNCLNKLCSHFLVEAFKVFLFSFICFAILYLDYEYFNEYSEIFFRQGNTTNTTNTTNITNITNFISYLIDNSTNNGTNVTNSEERNYGIGFQVFFFFLGYILFFPPLLLSTGVYLIPILYSVVKRKFITGELIYGLGCSNNLEIINSVAKITSMFSASTYLGALFLIHVVLEEKPSLEKYNEFFQFYKIPYTEAVFAIKFVFLVFVMLITNLEYINLGCCELNLADEGTFHLNSCASCQGRKDEYLKLAQEGNVQNLPYTNVEMSGFYYNNNIFQKEIIK